MPDQGVMTTPIFDELLAELGHEFEQVTEPESREPDAN